MSSLWTAAIAEQHIVGVARSEERRAWCIALDFGGHALRSAQRRATLGRGITGTFVATALVLVALIAPAFAGGPSDTEKPRREIFVPFADLNVVLENQPRRVLMSREEFDALVKRAKKTPEKHAPQQILLLAADYDVAAEAQRAIIRGKLTLEVLEEGLHLLPLDLGGIGLVSALLDGKPAALGPAGDGRLALVAEGVGRHELALEMVTPLETTAARQLLRFKLPRPPAAQMKLVVPGDVEVKSGAEIVSRVVEKNPRVTRFQLIPRPGDTVLAMTLNSHLAQQERAVVAASVLLSEVTQAYEKLHATVSLKVLYRAVDQLRFVVPAGFEIQEVASPLLARWDLTDEDGRKILNVRLREQTTDDVVLNIAAIKTQVSLDDWTAPRLEPLDVVGQNAVVALLLEERLRAESLSADKLAPIDVQSLQNALPASVLSPAPGTPPLRPVAAWYAAQGDFKLTGRFSKPAATLASRASLLLVLDDQGQQMIGGFAVLPRYEKRFSLDFTVPAGWLVDRVTGPNEQPLAFERDGAADAAGRIHVRLPEGIAKDALYTINFHATHVPKTWLGDWTKRTLDFPLFAVVGARRDGDARETVDDTGAIAVEARGDLIVQPQQIDKLTPLDDAEKAKHGLAGVVTNLAYRYEAPDYAAKISVLRTAPRLTARSLAFFQVRPEVLGVRYELVYSVEEARTRQLVFSLPESTPEKIKVVGLDGVKVKEPAGRVVDTRRHWTVLLEEPRRGLVRIAVEFEQPLASTPHAPSEANRTPHAPSEDKHHAERDEYKRSVTSTALPMISAEDVTYQSGVVAVEGSPELKVAVKTAARPVDVGELAEADYQPGRRLLGAYGFVGALAAVEVNVSREPGYRIYPAIVERAELTTHLAADGEAQTEANFRLRSKALFLELKLPDGAEFWSAMLDGEPLKPQRDGQSVLLALPAAAAPAARNLQFVYAAKVRGVALAGNVAVPAPRLLLRADRDTPGDEVPLNDLFWRLHLPSGYEVTRSGGTLTMQEIERPRLAVVNVAAAVYMLAGGVNPPFYGVTQYAREAKKSDQKLPSPYYLTDDSQYFPKSKEFTKTEKMESKAADKPAADMAPPAAAEPAVVENTEVAKGKMGLEKHLEQEKPRDARDSDEDRILTDKVARHPGELRKETDERVYPVADLVLPIKRAELRGVRSLKIQLTDPRQAGEGLLFRSLGVEPQLEVTLANRDRFDMLGWALLGGVLLWGIAWTNRPTRSKVKLVVALAAAATALPLAWHSIEVARLSNFVFYGASLLVPYFLFVGLVRLLIRGIAAAERRRAAATTAASLIIVAALVSAAIAGEPPLPPPPVAVPEDAIIVPYDPKAKTGIAGVDTIMVPYAQYVELWNRAHPDKKLEARKAPLPFAWAGAEYTATLAGDDALVLDGRLTLDVLGTPHVPREAGHHAERDEYVDEHVEVPLALSGGVLARAEVDGKPARIRLIQAEPQGKGKVAPAAPTLATLLVSGKGRHTLNVAVHLKITKQGGWRAVEGAVPAAAATSLKLTAPEAKTEVRLGQVADRRSYETEKPAETIATALAAAGAVKIEWRPKIAEAQVDRSLTARSTAVFDIEEDGLRMVWRLVLEFRRSQREQFSVSVPAGYLVERVDGPNVRGWQLKAKVGNEKQQTIEVELLQAAKDQEELTVALWRAGAAGEEQLKDFAVPVVSVPDAALHSGEITIRRSPLLDVRTLERTGVTRTDLSNDAAQLAGDAARPRPWGIRPFEAYRFAAAPFTLRLAAAPAALELSAAVQATVKIAAFQRTLEARIVLTPEGRRLYRAEIFLPDGLKLDNVAAPGEFQWSISQVDKRSLLTVYLAKGSEEPVAIVISGTLARETPQPRVPLPRLEVRGAVRQQGDLVVQADPGYDVEPVDLKGAEQVQLGRVAPWLKPDQQRIARVAIQYRDPAYSGALRLTAREPDVSCETITNVKVTSRTIIETIRLDFTIEKAGVRTLAFQLPAEMRGCRIKARGLRDKRIAGDEGEPQRVTLEFQDEMMGQLGVIVENDRLLQAKTEYAAPLPIVETGRTSRQYVAIESAGRDEVEIVQPARGAAVLNRNLREYQALAAKLSGRITQAFLIEGDAAKARLHFRARQREAVKTAGARVLLAETVLVLDASGGYRARQTYKIDNQTEPYLDVRLPAGAELWTATVAGEPVKPVRDATTKDDRLVRVPLVKTAPGDLDYAVVFRYGGRLDALGGLAAVEFPLVHAVGIKPESSVVEVCVPKNYRWVRFGGTMRLVEQTQVQTEIAGYEAKQLSNLQESLRSGDVYTKIRAANSLKQWKGQQDEGRRKDALVDQSRSMVRSDPQPQSGANEAIVQQIEQDIERLNTEQSLVVVDDNRAVLNRGVDEQKSMRANNVVLDVGRNWDVSGASLPQTAPQADKLNFNAGWLAANKLSGAGATQAAPDDPKKPGDGKEGGEQGGKASQIRWKGKPEAATALGNDVMAPNVAEGQSRQQLAQSQTEALRINAPLVAIPAGNESINAARYNERLQGANTYAGATNARGGNLVIQAQPNQYTGGTTVTSGTLRAAVPGAPGGDMGIGGAYRGAIQNQPFDQAKAPNAALVPQVYNPQGAVVSTTPSRPDAGAMIGGMNSDARSVGGLSDFGIERAPRNDMLASRPYSPVPTTPGTPPIRGLMSDVVTTDVRGSADGDQSSGGRKGGGQAAPPPPKAPPPATGLASLDVAMPEVDPNFYDVYRFTTPLGQTELTGWAVSQKLVGSLANLGIVAVVLLLGWAAVSVARRARFAWLSTGRGAALLIAGGLLMVVTGVFPVAGLAALIGGLMLGVRALLARRAATPPTPVEAVS